jgi:DNA-binding transcriptional ArsR family regulator
MLEEPVLSAGVTPPRVYVHSPAQEAYHPHISDAYFRTLIQIRGLTYRTGGDHTPPLTLDELTALRGISRRSMCRHLQALRSGGYVRIEPSGENAFVITPRRWEPRTGLPARPARGRGRLSARERAALFGDASAAAVSHDDILVHVVVESHDSLHESHKQHHEHDARAKKNDGDGDGWAQELADDLAGAMAAHGMKPEAARKKARRLLAEFGAEVCARQERVFERRCELARASRGGLRNPIGMLLASIEGDWSLPTEKDEQGGGRWYTEEEFELFFEH